jgi:CBS-domain-containing membrane protein
MSIFSKMKGSTKSPPRVSGHEIALSWTGAFLGIGLVAFLDELLLDRADVLLLVASFGASAALLYGAPRSPLAQPRNFIGGHVLSALVGVACFKLFQGTPWLAAAMAAATAVAVMHWAKALHPPGGATALVAVVGGDKIHSLGFLYVLTPVAAGALIMLVTALVFNNAVKTRRYPEFWW